MPEPDLVDNDIIFKIGCFGLNAEFAGLFEGGPPPRRLGLATFVLPKKIDRSPRVKDKVSARENVSALLQWAEGMEPTQEEVTFAAEIEVVAQQKNVAFDSGESLLLSAFLLRGARRLFTGDKRALIGLGSIAEHLAKQSELEGKAVCLEQVLLIILRSIDANALTGRICREREVDAAAAICCACASGGTNEAGITEGLQSYIRDLRAKSGAVLSA